jgi:hypothetical protein
MGFEAEIVFREGGEDFGDLGFVFFESAFSIDYNVIEVGVAEKSEVRVEDLVDEPLEDGRSGGEAHGHDGIFVEAVGGFEGGMGLRSGGHTDIGEAGAHVHGGDPVSACEIVHDCAGERDGVIVEFDFAIEVSVVNNEAELVGARVLYEENRCGGGRLRGSDETAF